MSMCMCLLLNQQYLVFVQIVADYPRPPPPPSPADTSVCVFLAKPLGPFVHTSSQVVSLLGLSHSSHTLSARPLESVSFSKSQCS